MELLKQQQTEKPLQQPVRHASPSSMQKTRLSASDQDVIRNSPIQSQDTSSPSLSSSPANSKSINSNLQTVDESLITCNPNNTSSSNNNNNNSSNTNNTTNNNSLTKQNLLNSSSPNHQVYISNVQNPHSNNHIQQQQQHHQQINPNLHHQLQTSNYSQQHQYLAHPPHLSYINNSNEHVNSGDDDDDEDDPAYMSPIQNCL